MEKKEPKIKLKFWDSGSSIYDDPKIESPWIVADRPHQAGSSIARRIEAGLRQRFNSMFAKKPQQ